MEKFVKIYISGRPVSLSNSIKAFGYHGPLLLNESDIFKCLASGAIVKEIIGDREINLTLSNYNKNNGSPVVKPQSKSEEVIIPTVPAKEEKQEEIKEEVAIPSNSVFISGETVVEEVSEEESKDDTAEEDPPVDEVVELPAQNQNNKQQYYSRNNKHQNKYNNKNK